MLQFPSNRTHSTLFSVVFFLMKVDDCTTSSKQRLIRKADATLQGLQRWEKKKKKRINKMSDVLDWKQSRSFGSFHLHHQLTITPLCEEKVRKALRPAVPGVPHSWQRPVSGRNPERKLADTRSKVYMKPPLTFKCCNPTGEGSSVRRLNR